MKLLALAALLFAKVEIAPGVVLIPGQLAQNRSPDGNSVLLRGDEGWVVIDTGRGGEHTDHLLRFLADSGAAPLAVLNTHWHLDHIGGNADFRREWPDATLLAHPALDAACGYYDQAHLIKEFQEFRGALVRCFLSPGHAPDENLQPPGPVSLFYNTVYL